MTAGLPQSSLSRLAAGMPLIALGVRSARGGEIARMARGAGYDALWIDLEHSAMPIDCAVQIAATGRDLGMAAWVRVPEKDYGVVGRLLDGGAGGIIAPRIETADEARAVISAARFAPRGQRSQIALLPQFGYRRLPPGEMNRLADAETVVQTLLETEKGIANAESIAALDGVDILGVGMNDLSADLGCAGNPDDPRLHEACRQVIAAAARHGKLALIGGLAGADRFRDLLRIGAAPYFFAGIDTDLLAGALVQRVQEARALASFDERRTN